MSSLTDQHRNGRQQQHEAESGIVQAERAMLGCLILGEPLSIVEQVIPAPALTMPHVAPLFSDPRHAPIFHAIRRLAAQGEIFDTTRVIIELQAHNQLDAAGGAAYPCSLTDEVYATSQLPQYCEIVAHDWRRRETLRILQHGVEHQLSAKQISDDLAVFADAIERGKAGNAAISAADFLTIDRPRLAYHIDRILPERGKLTLSAAAKSFKTTLEIILGLCLASGSVDYLGLRFNEPVSALFVQPELSDALLTERLAWIARTAPPGLLAPDTLQRFHVLESTHGRPSLWHEHPRCHQSRRELIEAIERTGARVVLVDSLYMAFAGMDENAADQMTLALDFLGSLAASHGVAIVLSHHFNKGGTAARGSSVFQGWGETDLTIAHVENEPDVLKVDALMRCAFPHGFPGFWRKPNEQTAWFELMPEGWEPEGKKGGRPAAPPPVVVRLALQASGRNGMPYGDLVRAVTEAASVKDRKAGELIKAACEAGLISKVGRIYGIGESKSNV